MKKFITILTTVIMSLAVLTSCSLGSSNGTIVNKGNLTKLVLKVGADSNNNYVLSDREYSIDEYSVTAYYSSGWQEVVTKNARIDGGEYMKKSSSGGLTFSSANSSHEFTVKVSYGGKEESFVVKAYKAEDIIKVQLKEKFFEGYKLGRYVSDVHIDYLDSTGKLLSYEYLPENSIVKIYDQNGNETFSGTYGTIREFKKDDAKVTFSLKDTTGACSSNVKILSKTEAKVILPGSDFTSYPQVNDEINLTNFAEKYLKSYSAQLWNAEKNADVKSAVYVTDKDGKAVDGYTIKVTVTRTAEGSDTASEITTGNFQKGDVVKVSVSIANCSAKSREKEYTVK